MKLTYKQELALVLFATLLGIILIFTIPKYLLERSKNEKQTKQLEKANCTNEGTNTLQN